MTEQDFEEVLNRTCDALTAECSQKLYTSSVAFEARVREVVQQFLPIGLSVNLAPPVQGFPDIVLGSFGIEVKFSTGDTWRSIANSVSEGSRDAGVTQIYLLFGKMGGKPAVKWAKYDDCVIHVRTSHVPRFEVEISSKGVAKKSLFDVMGITYAKFCRLPMAGKMKHIREYARERLAPGEHLWWLEDLADPQHSLPIQPRLYTKLTEAEKIQCRAEAVLLCPEILRGSRARGKYENAVSYLLTYRGILCYQARDLFSAGSVAHKKDKRRGGLYIRRSIQAIEAEIAKASQDLEDALFQEYWGKVVPKKDRLKTWLGFANREATGWKPSEHLFLNRPA